MHLPSMQLSSWKDLAASFLYKSRQGQFTISDFKFIHSGSAYCARVLFHVFLYLSASKWEGLIVTYAAA